MSDKQPTQEQIREFWEWCGWTFLPYKSDPVLFVKIHDALWLEPGEIEQRPGNWRFNLPPIDLNSLFKYAIPADKRICGIDFSTVFLPAGTKNILAWVALLFMDNSNLDGVCDEIEAQAETPALALFWAIWQVVQEEKDDLVE